MAFPQRALTVVSRRVFRRAVPPALIVSLAAGLAISAFPASALADPKQTAAQAQQHHRACISSVHGPAAGDPCHIENCGSAGEFRRAAACTRCEWIAIGIHWTSAKRAIASGL